MAWAPRVGLKFIIENRGNLGPEQLDKVTSNIIDEGNNSGLLRDLFSTSRADTPWLTLELDRSKCLALGVQITDVFNTLQVYVGSYYVNNFNQFADLAGERSGRCHFRDERMTSKLQAQPTRTNDSVGLAAHDPWAERSPWR
jgi:hypothetical protein